MDRRDFLKKAGLAGGLSAAGALTLKKEYVKPVVRMLEPSYAEAITPVLDVTMSQPAGTTVAAAGGATVTVGVWSIDVPLAAAIPVGQAVSVKIDYTFQGNGNTTANAGIPAGTTSTTVGGLATSPGQLRLAQQAGVSNTLVDGQANVASITGGVNATIAAALSELAMTTPGNLAVATNRDPGDAFLLDYTPTIGAASILGVNIPATALDTATMLFTGENA